MSKWFEKAVAFSAEFNGFGKCVEKNEICIAYAKGWKDGTVYYVRLPDLEKQLEKTDPGFDYAAYHSNQQHDDPYTEVEVHIKKGKDRIALSFFTLDIAKQGVISFDVWTMDEYEGAYRPITFSHQGFFTRVDEWKQSIYDYLQQMNDYRLYFATQDITLNE